MYNNFKNKPKNFIFLIVALIICIGLLSINKGSKNISNKKIATNMNTIDTCNQIALTENKNLKDSSNKKITQNIKSIKINTDKTINVETKSSKNILNTSNNDSNQAIERASRNGTINKYNSTFFKNSVFLGDSLTEGLRIYKILDKSNVVAKKGLSIYKTDSYIKKAISLRPQNVFILLGINDIVDPNLTTEKFIKRYLNIVTTLKKGLPNSKIYVLSVLPVKKNAQQKQPSLSNERINNFNNSLKNMCTKLNISFIDIRSTLIKNDKYYQCDGIHLKSGFYPILLKYIKKQLS